MPNLFLLLSALSSLSTGIETNFQSVLEHSSHDGSLDTTVVNNWNACEKYSELNYSNFGHDDSFSANAFSNSFINEDGGGQYFFETKSENVNLIYGTVIQTSWLRCSYIENQYLVLSPNRKKCRRGIFRNRFSTRRSIFIA